MIDFVNTENWDLAEQFLEQHHDLLFLPETAAFLSEEIIRMRNSGDQALVKHLEMRRVIIQACKERGIAPAIEQLKRNYPRRNRERSFIRYT